MPGLFEQFPHTNLHELNLDWIIDLLNQFKEELEDSAVLSVNGQTGHVTLYESENVILPPLPSGVDQWRLVRMMNGQNIGILFYDGKVWLQRGNTTLRLLTRDDIPTEAGVVSWNGQTGVVIANGATIIRSTDDPVSIDQAITTETTERTNQDNAIRNTISAMSKILADTPQNATQMPMSSSDTTTVADSINTLNSSKVKTAFLSWGTSLTVPDFHHGLLLISLGAAYIVWAPSTADIGIRSLRTSDGTRQAQNSITFGADDINESTYTITRNGSTLTITTVSATSISIFYN